MKPISQYISEYPDLSHTELARVIIDDCASTYAERTLRRMIAAERSKDTLCEPDTLPPPAARPAHGLTQHTKYYHYNEPTDTYLCFLPGEKPFNLRGETLRELKAAYSDWNGSPQTINEICRRFTLSRKLFTKLKNAFGWSHDADPFTDEEILTRPEDDLVDDLIQTRKFALEQKFESRRLQEQARDAQCWREFKSGTLQPFEYALDKLTTKDFPATGEITLPERNPYQCVLSPFDLHFGKQGWIEETGTEYNRQIARYLLLSATDELLSDLQPYPLEKFIVPVGSDFFHVDTDKGETTGGTRQDTDGSVVQIYAEGCALMIEFIQRLAGHAPVEIILTAGNHDRLLSHALLLYLQGYYRESARITVTVSHLPRQYVQFGETLMGFTHGDGVKPQDLPLLMLQESRAQGVIRNRIWFTGHYHSTKVSDLKGTLLIQMPSLSGADRWHARNGYVGSIRGMCAYVICERRGLRLQLHATL